MGLDIFDFTVHTFLYGVLPFFFASVHNEFSSRKFGQMLTLSELQGARFEYFLGLAYV